MSQHHMLQCTLNNSLNKMKGDVDKKMLDLRLGVENGSRKINYNENITDHEYARSSGSAIEMDHDYMKQISLSNDSERHHGYRFNIDNLDFLLQVRNMTRITKTSQSIMYSLWPSRTVSTVKT